MRRRGCEAVEISIWNLTAIDISLRGVFPDAADFVDTRLSAQAAPGMVGEIGHEGV